MLPSQSLSLLLVFAFPSCLAFVGNGIGIGSSSSSRRNSWFVVENDPKKHHPFGAGNRRSTFSSTGTVSSSLSTPTQVSWTRQPHSWLGMVLADQEESTVEDIGALLKGLVDEEELALLSDEDLQELMFEAQQAAAAEAEGNTFQDEHEEEEEDEEEEEAGYDTEDMEEQEDTTSSAADTALEPGNDVQFDALEDDATIAASLIDDELPADTVATVDSELDDAIILDFLSMMDESSIGSLPDEEIGLLRTVLSDLSRSERDLEIETSDRPRLCEQVLFRMVDELDSAMDAGNKSRAKLVEPQANDFHMVRVAGRLLTFNSLVRLCTMHMPCDGIVRSQWFIR